MAAERLRVDVENNFVFQPLLAAGIEIKKVSDILKSEYLKRPRRSSINLVPGKWSWQAIS